jgi:C4-type Zn-finger protein
MGKAEYMRAKYKPYEEMPEREKCCEQTRENMRNFLASPYNIPFNLEGNKYEKDCICAHCGFNRKAISMTNSTTGRRVALDTVDIEEGS